MAHYRFTAYLTANRTRWIVLSGPQQQILEYQRLEAGADLGGAMTAAITRLEAMSWQAEGSAL